MKIYDREIFEDFRFTDTRVGTLSRYEYSNGNTLPLVGSTHGDNYYAVQTNGDRGSWWFDPKSDSFEGFRLTHQPSPWMGDFSHLLILPFSGELEGRKYLPDSSLFYPHINQIMFSDGDYANLVSYDHDAIIDYHSYGKASFLISGEGLELKKVGNDIEGFVVNYAGCEDKNFTMHIKLSFDSDVEFRVDDMGYVISSQVEILKLRISTSFISKEQATLNHARMEKDFGLLYKKAKDSWLKYFDKFEVDNEFEASAYDKYERYDRLNQVKFFYHSVYRAFLFPMKHFEVDEFGDEVHYDTTSKSVKKGKLYTNIGLWDAQKTLFPLISLVDSKLYEDILEGFLNSFRNSGYLPKWLSPDERGLMPGTLVDNVIADASSKGIAGEMMDEFLVAMIKSAENDADSENYGRKAAKDYRRYGYVPSDYHESVNQTLDNCLADFSIGVVAKNLGKEDLANKYFDYSKNYRNLFDPSSGLMREKDKEGRFGEDFNPLSWGSPYTEGSSYQNSYNVYHDVEGLVELFKGKDKFFERLVELTNADTSYDVGVYGMVIHEIREFDAARFGHIAISNQPSFHIPYLYHYVDKSEYTEQIVKELLLNYFKYDFDGFPGDEDNGSMASWFILSSLGIYPLCPGKGEYVMGIPFYNKVKVKLDNENVIEIEALENYHHKKYVDWVRLDDELFEGGIITHKKLMNTKKIQYRLAIVPK